MPADIEGVLGWSHPGGRNSNAGMAISRFGQLGKLLDKATDIVPATVALLQLLDREYMLVARQQKIGYPQSYPTV